MRLDGPSAPDLSSVEVLCGPGGPDADRRSIRLGAGGLPATVELAVELQAAHRRHMPSVVCTCCGCYKPAGQCVPRPWPFLRRQFELLRLDVATTDEVPRTGLTVWTRRLAPGEGWQSPPSPALAEGEQGRSSTAGHGRHGQQQGPGGTLPL